MNAPDKAVAFEALMKDTPGFDHYDSGYDGILPECRNEYSNAIVHAFQKFRAPFSGKIVHIFPEQSAVI